MDKEKIKEWFKPLENKLVFALILFAVILRLYYFFKLGAQPIWWDEGDYLAISKVWATGMSTPEWWSHFTGMRPLLMPVLWAGMMKLMFSEILIRFLTLLVPSIISIYLVYAIARDMYSKKLGIIAGFIMSVYWVFLFYSFRLLTDIPAVCLGLLTIFYFYKYYLHKIPKHLYLAVLFGVLAFYARFPYASVLITCFLFLLIVEKKSFFLNKTNWKALGLIALMLSPYIIYFVFTKFFLFQFYFGASAESIKTPYPDAFKYIFGMFPSLLGSDKQGASFPFFLNIFFLALLVGILTLYESIMKFGRFWKREEKSLDADYFLMLWIIIQLFLYVIIIRSATDRWLLILMPPLFMLVGRAFFAVKHLLSSYSKQLATFVVIALILLGGYFQLVHGNWLIDIKKTSYQEIKDSGLWFKQNTPENTKIITASIVQNQYYSERQSYDFYTNSSVWAGCPIVQTSSGAIYTNESCYSLTENAFNEKVKMLNPDYLVISIFEPGFQPPWALSYPQRYNLTFVKAYPSQNPLLIVYKF